MEPAVDLDSVEELRSIDSSDMLGVLGRFPQQSTEALEIGRTDLNLPSAEGVKEIVILGMGGSGISGDVVSAIAGSEGLSVPVITVKGYYLPPFVGEDSLVFAISYSGNTEETINCYADACSRGARMVAVTSGGEIARKAAGDDVPCFKVPSGFQPRASLGYLFIPILSTLERMGFLNGVVTQIEELNGLLMERSEEYKPEIPLDDNPAKRLAKELVGFLPVVYSSEGIYSVAALRWKAQLNENAKVPAFHNLFPELNHNETVGWEHLQDVCTKTHIVVLREPEEYPRIEKRIKITLDLIENHVGRITHVWARGGTPVERLLDIIYFGDFTSVYLALALGQDPTPVDRISELKQLLASD
ncbi:MAG: bifunctional phosphoglucose/phosphomannose isomerase [Actinobacteria bacterium]|nr:bifunctional phosphoglucose/phosphomannose isomerase [Actinomycetota bacterium]